MLLKKTLLGCFGSRKSGHNRRSRSYHPQLPPELLYLIFDFCQDEPSALRNCSLVSRLWRRTAQGSVLSSVFIFSTSHNRSLTAFISFLKTQPESLAYIRDVYVKAFSMRDGHVPIELCMRAHELRTALAMLPQLRLLHIEKLSVIPGQPAPSATDMNLVGSHIKLGTLELHSICILGIGGHEESFRDLIGSFVEIDTLILDDVSFSYTGVPVQDQRLVLGSTKLSSPIRVRKLDLRRPHFESVQDCTRCISMRDLRVLRLENDVHHISVCSTVYQPACIGAATEIEELEIYLMLYSSRAPLHLSLSKCHALKTMVLTLSVSSHSRGSIRRVWNQAVRVLATLPPSSKVSLIRFLLIAPASYAETPPHCSPCTEDNWTSLTRTLERIETLSHVEFVITPSILPGPPLREYDPAVVDFFRSQVLELSSLGRYSACVSLQDRPARPPVKYVRLNS